MDEATFRKMCQQHDLTHSYSDSWGTVKHGQDELVRIRAAARELGMDKAIPIWNEVVDTKLREGFREQFYWRP